ncbi:MAG: hypothetical protein FJY54_05345 [Betaproteobacteria bacterium]|nr:hypothetical protein [Betaproteobacteria bacterium]
MRYLSGGLLMAALCFAPAAMADGYGHHKHHHRQHHYGHPKHHVHHHYRHYPPAWGHYKRKHHHYHHHYAYAYAPPPGVHVIFPNVYIPWPQPR